MDNSEKYSHVSAAYPRFTPRFVDSYPQVSPAYWGQIFVQFTPYFCRKKFIETLLSENKNRGNREICCLFCRKSTEIARPVNNYQAK